MLVNVKEKPTDFVVVFDFFGRNSSHSLPPPPPPSQAQDNRICDIASSSNIFENFKFSKMLDKDAISRIWEFWDCDGGKLDDENRGDGGNWVTKIAPDKIALTFSIFSVTIFVT